VTDPSPDGARLRAAWTEAVGAWTEDLGDFAEVDPGFFERYLDLAAHPWRHGVLEPKVKALVQLSVDAAATHLYGPGVRHHLIRALELGATAAEIIETLELTATMGIHACNVGVPILLEELAAAGRPLETRPLTAREEEVMADFIAKRGYWNDFWDGILRLDAEFFAAYTAFSAWSWEHGVLEPKVKELIYTAFDASATHMFLPGLRQHIRNAIAYGATREEIMEVFELASGIGAKSFALAAPVLREESGA
jgi:alkylhydroperoxidase/carboxymuconolactone decarboxylase family protein YurZ